uniref:WH1 domain-containing protein n=1 Tax=Syphacia muris TaxID=451379 RepID=A0A0N5AWK0_9BILA
MATADVMVYDDATKRWLSPDGSIEPARSQVRILHNSHTNAFRIVGTRLQDRQWILNCNVYERLKYNRATPLFHQWRDEKRKVYGLSFMSEEDAQSFINVITRALTLLASSNDYQNGSGFSNSNGIYHEPQQLHHVAHSEPSFRDPDQESICSGGVPANVTNNYRLVFYIFEVFFKLKSSHSVLSSAGAGLTLSNAQRRASQGSSSSSNGSSGPGIVYAPSNVASSSVRNVSVPETSAPASANIPPVPPIPPATLCTTSHSTASAPSAPSAPPAPPPPPPMGGFGINKSSAPSIADQIKNVQLRKTTNQNSTTSAKSENFTSNKQEIGGGRGALVSELEATLNKRKNFVENIESRSSAAESSSSSNVVKRAWERPGGNMFTNLNNGGSDASRTHKNVNRAPSGSSLSSQEEPKQNMVSVVSKGGDSSTPTTLTYEMLEKWKIDLLHEVEEKIDKAKSEILEAIKSLK